MLVLIIMLKIVAWLLIIGCLGLPIRCLYKRLRRDDTESTDLVDPVTIILPLVFW